MKKLSKPALSLRTATIRQLTAADLAEVAGAGACSVTREVSRQCVTEACPGKPWTGITG